MSVITIERQLFYAEAVSYKMKKPTTPGQVHLRVRSIRIPWGQGETRTLGYMDEVHFGGTGSKLDTHNLQNVKNFYMGKSHDNPKLIVAPVQMADLYTRPEMAKLLATKMKQTLARQTFSSLPVTRSWRNESIWDKLPDDERAKLSRSSSGAKKQRRNINRPTQFHYNFEYPATRPGEVWLLVDPSYNSRRGVAYSTAKSLAKRHLGAEVDNNLFKRMEGDRKIFNQDGVMVLGVAYRLQYWKNVLPREGVLWLESIQKRVREHLEKELPGKMAHPPAYSTALLNTMRAWYAMGAFSVPEVTRRFAETPAGRLRKIRGFTPGRGFAPVHLTQKEALRPLFVVNARNEAEAQQKAQNFIAKLVNDPNPDVTSRGMELTRKWDAGGNKVVPRLAMAYVRGEKTQ